MQNFILKKNNNIDVVNVPVILVHGSGETAINFMKTYNRFIQSGYTENEIFAITFTTPYLEAVTDFFTNVKTFYEYILDVCKYTNRDKIDLIGHSRGVMIIRGMLKKFPKIKEKLRKVVLIAGPNKGISRITSKNHPLHPESEFLQWINEENDVNELDVLSLRSLDYDFYFQNKINNDVDYDSPFLDNAINEAIPKVDHYEIQTSEASFNVIYNFIKNTTVKKRSNNNQNLQIQGLVIDAFTKMPITEAIFTLYECNNGIRGKKIYSCTINNTGFYEPINVDPDKYYETEILHKDYFSTNYFLPPFTQSSTLINFTVYPLFEIQDIKDSGLSILLHRCFSTFIHTRDSLIINNKELLNPDIAPLPSDENKILTNRLLLHDSNSISKRKQLITLSAYKKKISLEYNKHVKLILNSDNILYVRPSRLRENELSIAYLFN